MINGLALGLTVFGLFAATVTPTFRSVLLAVFMLIGWVASLFFEMLYLIAERQAEMLARAVKAEATYISGAVKTRLAGAVRVKEIKGSPRTVSTEPQLHGEASGENNDATDTESADSPVGA